MNLIITDICNRSCPYCFAKSRVNLAGEPIGPAPQHITLDNVEKYLDFLVKGDNPMLKVLGGEPTLHPQFLEIVHRGRQRGLPTQVFSNALWPRKVQEALSGAPLKEWKLGFVFNVNEPSLQSKAQWEHAKASMKIAGAQGICGFNIYREQFDLQFIPDLMDEAGLERSLRLGLASPIVGTENSFLGIQSLKAIGARLVSELSQLEKRNVLGMFDCGFPLCMFAEENLGSLLLNSRGFQSVCKYPIDVGPDLTAWPCFPLNDCENVRIQDFNNLGDLQNHFSSRLAGIRRMGTMDECLTCKYLQRNQCCGGCVARTIKDWVAKGDTQLLAKLGWRTGGAIHSGVIASAD
jgi:MoaA/NifB/PqqE/SkfB family radical SAM enzyme